MHEKHRERVRKRYLKEGFDSFEPHQILEMLLFYTIPVKDTNELAHNLLNKFGSISNVLDASPKDLMMVNGIGEKTAIFLSTYSQMNRVYNIDKQRKKPYVRTTQEAGEYVASLFLGRIYETFFVVCLDSQCKIIHSELITEGTIDELSVYPRLVVETAIRCKAHSIILAHNHPGGSITPSQNDIVSTKLIIDALRLLNIEVQDHFIISNNNYFSFKDTKLIN